MKKLLLLRGAPASGKSTFIKENNLEPYVISSDNLRLMVAGLSMDLDGNLQQVKPVSNALSIKEVIGTFNNRAELDAYIDAHRNDRTLEGMVLVDDRGYMCKEKFLYYIKIKQLRRYLNSCIKAYFNYQPLPQPKQAWMKDVVDKTFECYQFDEEELKNLHVIDAVWNYEYCCGPLVF